MKLVVVCLVLLPVVLCASVEKRFFLDSLSKVFDIDTLKKHVQEIANRAGSDASKAGCLTECHQIVPGDLLGSGCPLICTSFQSLVRHFNIAPKA